MGCTTGNLETIKAPSSTTPCGCECDINDITIATNLTCIGSSAGDTLSTVFTDIDTAICTLQTDSVIDGSSWCAPNANATPPASATLQEVIDFLAEELIPRTGNSCNCPIKNDLYFENTEGIRQCDGEGYVVFNGDVMQVHTEEQVQLEADLKVSNGLGAGIGDSSDAAALNLATADPSDLKLTYRIDAKTSNVAVTLPELADANGYNANRIIVLKRVDNCNTTYAVTVSAFSGETIEGAASKVLVRGHSWVLHGSGVDGEWSIIADYTDMCSNGGSVSTVGVGETSLVDTDLIGLTTADFTFFVDGVKCQSAGTNANISFNGTTGTITYLVSFTAGVERQLVIHNPI